MKIDRQLKALLLILMALGTYTTGPIVYKALASSYVGRLPCNYLIFLVGSTTYAQNCQNGSIDASSTDPGSVLQTAITRLSTTGGTIRVTNGTYTYTSTVPAFPRNIPQWLKIIGDGGVIFKLSASASTGFTINRVADYDTFSNIWIEGFTFDQQNIGGNDPVVIGGYTHQQRINYDNITILNIQTRNVKENFTTSTDHRNVEINTYQLGAGEAIQNYIKHVRVENCVFGGGSTGVSVAGGGSLVKPGMNIFYDDIQVHHIKYSAGSVPNAYASTGGAGVGIGANAFGGSAYVTDSQSYYSPDVGFEISNAQYALFQNDLAVDSGYANFIVDNFAYPGHITNYVDQHVLFDNTQSQILHTLTTGLYGYGYVVYDDSSRLGLGDITFRGANYYAVTPKNLDGAAFLISSVHGIRSVSILDGSNVRIDAIQGPSSAWGAIDFVYSSFANVTTQFTVRDFHQYVRGAKGASDYYVQTWNLNGPMKLSFDNIVDDVSVTSMASGYTWGIRLGGATTTASGVINNYRPTIGVDTAPSGLYIYGKSTLTIPTNLTISNCDFTGLPVGATEIAYDTTGGSNAGNVIKFANTMKDGTLLSNPIIEHFIRLHYLSQNSASVNYFAFTGDDAIAKSVASGQTQDCHHI